MRKIIFASIMALVFAGCAIPDKSVSNVYRSDNNKYIVNSTPLDYKVTVLGYKSKFRGNLLLASVDVKNNDPESHDLEYRFSWLDETGFEVGKTPWLPLTLNGKEIRSVQRIATTQRAESFKFYIRPKQ